MAFITATYWVARSPDTDTTRIRAVMDEGASTPGLSAPAGVALDTARWMYESAMERAPAIMVSLVPCSVSGRVPSRSRRSDACTVSSICAKRRYLLASR